MSFDTLILDLAEDDYTGLWELVWGANAVIPKSTANDLIDLLRSDVERLMREGRLALFRGTQFIGDEQSISVSEASSLLASPQAWQPASAKEIHLRVLSKEPPPQKT